METLKQQEIILEKESKKEELKKIEKDSIKEDKIKNFYSKEEGLSYIENKINEYNLNLLVIGRESFKEIDKDTQEIKFYINLIGDEDSIYRFFKDIENSEKNIKIEEESFFLEKKDFLLEAKINIMYISKNKKEKNMENSCKKNIFNRSKVRVLKKKRRILE